MDGMTGEAQSGHPDDPDQKADGWPQEQLRSQFGRLWQQWPSETYLFPADKREQDRLDLFHQLLKVVLQHRLHTPASRVEPGSHVLDIGCGTGIWLWQLAMEAGHKDSIFVGADVQLTQASCIPEIVRFTRANIEAPWTNDMTRHAPYDLINCRMMKGAIKSWPTVYSHVAAHLKPGSGVFEQVELDWTFRNDDGPVPAALQRWQNEIADVMERNGTPIRVDPAGTRAALQAAGFVDVKEDAIVMPISQWPADDYGREIGRWFQLALMHSVYPLALGPLCRGAGKSMEYVEDLDDDVQREVRSHEHTAGVYCILYIWSAKTSLRD